MAELSGSLTEQSRRCVAMPKRGGRHTFLTKQMAKLTPEEVDEQQLNRYGIHKPDAPEEQGSQDTEPPAQPKKTSPGSGGKGGGKAKYRPVTEAGAGGEEVVRLPGRVRCECQARVHGLVNNCLSCGRVVCDQEGSGPCFFCQALVATNAEEAVLAAGTKKSRELRIRLMGGLGEEGEAAGGGVGPKLLSGEKLSLASIGSAFQKAAQDKDRLLSFDKDSVRRTKVIDDQNDYFASSAWMDMDEREAMEKRRLELHKLRHAPRSQRQMKMSLDFQGRQVTEIDQVAAAELRALEELNAREEAETSRRYAKALQEREEEMGMAAPNIAFRPMYGGQGGKAGETGALKGSVVSSGRVQDFGGFSEMGEAGWCLSLHQPHASLLVRGIKRHEGRNWGSEFRGPLWIHAGGKPIPKEDIQKVEDFYREYYDGDLPAALPIQYPTGCVVGQVNVVDVLPKEDYDLKYPEGESEAPFVLVCEAPLELPFHIPTAGGPKVFRLPPNIKQALAKSKFLATHY